MASEQESTHHHHALIPREKVITEKGTKLVVDLVHGPEMPGQVCPDVEVSSTEPRSLPIDDIDQIDRSSQRSTSIGLGGINWGADWQPKGPTPPYRTSFSNN